MSAPDKIAEAITGHYGDRCEDFSEGCACCEAWAQYDRMTPPAADYVAGLEAAAVAAASKASFWFNLRDKAKATKQAKEARDFESMGLAATFIADDINDLAACPASPDTRELSDAERHALNTPADARMATYADMRAALDAAEARAVKPLVWDDWDNADTVVGLYRVRAAGRVWAWTLDDDDVYLHGAVAVNRPGFAGGWFVQRLSDHIE